MRNKTEKGGLSIAFIGLYVGIINSIKGDDFVIPTFILALGIAMYFLAE